MFTIQFYITDISITLVYLFILNTFVKACQWSGSDQDNTVVSNGSPRTCPIVSWLRVVWATVANLRFGFGSGLEPNWNRSNVFYPINKLTCNEPAVFWLVQQFREVNALAPNRYLSSDRITIWYIRTRCSFGYSFTTCCPICDPINIHWVTAKITQILALFHSNSTNIDRIANWSAGATSARKSSAFTCISSCDTIRTQILNWSPRSDVLSMTLCGM